MTQYSRATDIDYSSTGDTIKTGVEKLDTEIDDIYTDLNAIETAWTAGDATLSAAIGAGDHRQIIFVGDVKAYNEYGGELTAGGWTQRTLNTTWYNGITGASLGSNLITLPVGTYIIDARVPAHGVDLHKAVLNVTAAGLYPAATLVTGTTARSPDASQENHWSFIFGYFTITGISRNVQILHYTQNSNTTANREGGQPANISGYSEVYTTVMIERIE